MVVWCLGVYGNLVSASWWFGVSCLGQGIDEFIYGLGVAFGSEVPSSLVFLYMGGDLFFGCGWWSVVWVSVVIVWVLVWCSCLGSGLVSISWGDPLSGSGWWRWSSGAVP